MNTGKKACCGAGACESVRCGAGTCESVPVPCCLSGRCDADTCESVPVPCFLSLGLVLLSEIRSFSVVVHLDTLMLKPSMFLSGRNGVADVHFTVKVLSDEITGDIHLNVERGRIGR